MSAVMTASKPFHVIVDVVASYRDVTELDLKSARRHQAIAQARFEVCWLARQLTTLSLPAIGRHLGGRDYSTVAHAIGRVARAMDGSAAYAVEMIEMHRLARRALQDADASARARMPAPDPANAAPDVAPDGAAIARRILAPGRSELVWSRVELEALATALLTANTRISVYQAACQAVVKQLQNDLSKLS